MDAALYLLPDEIEHALKHRHLVVGDTGDEHLLDGRLRFSGGLAEAVGISGDGAQVHQLQALALNLLNHDGQDLLLAFLVFWQEDEASAVFSLFRYRYALEKDKLMGDLQQYAGTVAGLAVSALGSTMPQVLKNLQSVVYKLVALSAMDVNYHSYATSVMLVGTVVQSICLHLLMFLCFTYQFVCKINKYITKCKAKSPLYSLLSLSFNTCVIICKEIVE